MRTGHAKEQATRPSSASKTSLVGALALGLLCVAIPDPLVYTFRAAFCAVLLSGGMLASLLAMIGRRRRIAIVFAAIELFASWQTLRPAIDRRTVIGRSDRDAIDIERHFIVGYGNVADAEDLVRLGHVGGIFLTQRNVRAKAIPNVEAEIAALQLARHDTDLPPLVVAADQEGGAVSHLSPPLPAPPALSLVAAEPDDQRNESAYRLGLAQGSALKMIGVTLDLAPVADLMPSGHANLLDLHTQIATRSISSDPTIVAIIAAGFSAGLLAAGVTPTAKHFPGLGRVATDTHLFGASLAAPEDDLARSDWIPFRAILAIPGAAVMLSHVTIDAIDPDRPASRSRRVVEGLLRTNWGFDGVAMTDDLTMGAIVHAGLCHAVEDALNAGIDLLLVSWDTDKTFTALRCALEALDAGRLDKEMLRASARRLDRLRALSTAF